MGSINFEKAKNLTLEEALGVYFDAAGEEYEDKSSPAGEMTEIDEEIDESIMEFERDSANLERVERAFDKKIVHLINESKRFRSFSDKWEELLSEAVKCRKEYESTVGHMITVITGENIDLFRTVLPAEFHEDIIMGAAFAIGALRTTFESTYGAGAAVCRLMAGASLMIDWFWVDTMFRRRGVFTFLMGELLHRAASYGVKSVDISFPANDENKLLLSYITASFGFELSTGISSQSVIRLGDIENIERITSMKKGADYLSSLSNKEKGIVTGAAFKRFDYHGYLLHGQFPQNYIEPEFSCYIGTATDPKALLLAHMKREGVLRAEYIGFEKGCESYEAVLYAALLYKAASSLDANITVVIPEGSNEAKKELDSMCPLQLGRYLIKGRLVNKGM